MLYEATFVYTAVVGGIRVDYLTSTRGGPTQEVINDNYDVTFDTVYKELNGVEESFRSVRRYKTHAEFAADRKLPPLWFRNFLDKYIPAITP
jgi:hypothetical protein